MRSAPNLRFPHLTYLGKHPTNPSRARASRRKENNLLRPNGPLAQSQEAPGGRRHQPASLQVLLIAATRWCYTSPFTAPSRHDACWFPEPRVGRQGCDVGRSRAWRGKLVFTCFGHVMEREMDGPLVRRSLSGEAWSQIVSAFGMPSLRRCGFSHSTQFLPLLTSQIVIENVLRM